MAKLGRVLATLFYPRASTLDLFYGGQGVWRLSWVKA